VYEIQQITYKIIAPYAINGKFVRLKSNHSICGICTIKYNITENDEYFIDGIPTKYYHKDFETIEAQKETEEGAEKQRTPKLYLNLSLGDALVGLGFDRNAKVPEIELLNTMLQDSLVNVLKTKDILSAKAFIELSIINRAINKDYYTLEEWEPNWENPSEHKYYPYFSVSVGGFGLSDTNYRNSTTDFGSRLYYKTMERAEHAGKTFMDLYKKLNKI